MSDRPVVTGTFSASMTIFSTAVVLLLVQDDLSIVFAGLLSSIVSNTLSDGLSVAAGGDQKPGTFGQVALAELCIGLPFLLVVLYFTYKQRSNKPLFGGGTRRLTRLTTKDRTSIILILSVLNLSFVVGVMVWQGTKEDWQQCVWLIPVVSIFSISMTYNIEKYLFPNRPTLN